MMQYCKLKLHSDTTWLRLTGRNERKAEIQHLNTIRMRMTAFTAKPDMKPGLFKTKLSVYRANCP